MLLSVLASCNTTEDQTEAPTEAPTEASSQPPEEIIEKTVFPLEDCTIIYPSSAQNTLRSYFDDIFNLTGIEMARDTDRITEKDGTEYITRKEILIGMTDNRAESDAAAKLIDINQFVIKVDGNKVIVMAHDSILTTAMDYFMDNFMSQAFDACLTMPSDYCMVSEPVYEMVSPSIEELRDCFIFVDDDGALYAYGKGSIAYKNTSGKLDGEWTSLGVVATKPAGAENDPEAPEVYKHNGAYYMLSAYKSSTTGRNGITVMRADTPAGPFAEVSNGTITPSDWDSNDATLHIDLNGQPWLVFVHEATTAEGGTASVVAATLSEDLLSLTSEPIELFRADGPTWSRSVNAEGPCVYRTTKGELMIIWSTWEGKRYCVAMSYSSNGQFDGEWTHESRRLYSQKILNTYDGGHPSLFTLDGQLWLSIHTPDTETNGVKTAPLFITVAEEGNALVWGLSKD